MPTTPDGYPYITDYNQPADMGAWTATDATASQAALDAHEAAADPHPGYAPWSNGIPRFATAAARDAAIPSPIAGQMCYVNNLAVSIGGLTQRYEAGAWKVVVGDTGWRNISGLLANGWNTESGIMVRRVGMAVQLALLGAYHTTGSTAALMTAPPAGFTPGPAALFAPLLCRDYYQPVGQVDYLILSANPWLGGPSSATAGRRFYATAIYFTSDTWPVTLPGTPGS